MFDPIYSIVFTTALMGSGHCLGMCGPVVAALSLAGPGRRQGVFFHLLYNAGRLTTYVLIGSAAGWIGSLLTDSSAYTQVSNCILLAADIFVIGIGLRTTGLIRKLGAVRLEFPSSVQAMTKAVSGLQRLPGMVAAYPAGLLMGFLPCGFLYAIALAAAGRGSVVQGGLIMFFFGLGTVPAMFVFGSTVHWLTAAVRGELLRWAGLMVMFVGGYNLYRHLNLTGWL